MTAYTISSLKQDVRIALDQNMVNTQLAGIGDINTLSLDDIIESKIVDAARQVELSAPVELLDGGTAISSPTVTWESQAGYGPGSIDLPADFLRLVVFKMSDWDHPVYHAITQYDPLYALQRSRFGGVRGNPQKPVVAIVSKASNAAGQYLKLEFYSCAADSNASVSMMAYVPKPVISSGSISLCTPLKSAIVYKAAAMTAQSIQRNDLAAVLEQQAANLMVF